MKNKDAYDLLARTPRVSARKVAKALAEGRPLKELATAWAKPEESATEAPFLTPSCEQYPLGLRNLCDPPLRLFTRGKALGFSAGLVVAVVGSRKASPFSLRFARDLGRELTLRSISVCSGLALGVDAAAHRGALEALYSTSQESGLPIGVLGHGWEHIYPWQNRKLRTELESSGILLSEYAPDHPPSRWTFPARNRIIAALSQHVVVVEAGERSGSLYTAEFALDLGKNVWTVPQRPSVNSCGGLKLLADGAHPLISIADFCESLGFPKAQSPSRVSNIPSFEDPRTKLLLDLLARGESSFQTLADQLQWSPQLLAGKLAQLQLRGIVAPSGLGHWEVVSPECLDQLLKLGR